MFSMSAPYIQTKKNKFIRLIIRPMHVRVIHNAINSAGGAEKVCLAIIEALKHSRFDVELATVEPTDWSRLSRIIGRVVKPDREVSILPYKIRTFGIYHRLLANFYARKLRKKYDLA